MDMLPESNLLRDRNVIIADDDRASRKLLVDACRHFGPAQLLTPTTEADVVEMLKERSVHLIVCHWTATLSCPRLTSAIRNGQTAAFRRVAIIGTKANATRDEVLQARDAGVNEFLAPPLTIAAMAAKIRSIFDKPRGFVQGSDYMGPDRRRRGGDSAHPTRRKTDTPEEDVKRDFVVE